MLGGFYVQILVTTKRVLSPINLGLKRLTLLDDDLWF
jgi:hypothetical protein